MLANTTVYLFGSLRKTKHSGIQCAIDFTLTTPRPVEQVIRDLNIPENRVQLTMVNHRAVSRDTIVHPGDRLALFPSEYPLFADWKDLRSGK